MVYTSMERALVRMTSFFVRKPVHDDDVVDRLHHNASLLLLLLFAAGTALQEYAGEPINCWTPNTYPQEHYTQHVNGYCWTHPLRYPISSQQDLLEQRRVINFGTAFYRWVTLIFVLQAMLFKLPNVVWNYLNRQSGASLSKLRDLLVEAQLNKEERHQRMDEAAQYLHSWLAAYRTPSPRRMLGREIRKLACLFQGCGRRSGKYICTVYLTVKVLYLLNVVGNFVLLTVFLDAEFWRYGITVLNSVLINGDWSDPVNFPRLLICDFRLHQSVQAGETTDSSSSSSDSKVHTVQCILSINMILEKLFVLQWFWLVTLAILTVVTFITWAINTVCACAPYLFARKYMKSLWYRGKDDDSRSGERFVKSYLREDGILVLRMVEANTDHMVVKELVQHLWDNFQARDAAFSKELTEEIEMMMKDDTKEEDDTSSTEQEKTTEDKEETCEV
ncbi:innexin unc-9-like isoform X2 [Babylonia areolata]|uniref:innexin unc-9-like isoform X2 n=1 Tax=Babylonia areolata TaxID=304850 RepID=UPI003FD24273